MTGFVKLFGSILSSTIWQEDPATRIVWVTMLAMANRDGEVEASVPGLAHYARVTIEEAQTALEKFLSPDVYSRSPEHQGRRIELIDGGWRLLNHEKYRDKMSVEDRREKDAERQRRKRERQKCHANNVTGRDVSEMSQEICHTDANTDSETKRERKQIAPAAPVALPDWLPLESWNGYMEMRSKQRKPMTPRAKALLLEKLDQLRKTGNDVGKILDASTLNSWLDVYPLRKSETTYRPSMPLIADAIAKMKAEAGGSARPKLTEAERLSRSQELETKIKTENAARRAAERAERAAKGIPEPPPLSCLTESNEQREKRLGIIKKREREI